MKHALSASFLISSHFGGLTVHTSASTEDRLNSLKQVSGRPHPIPQISVACATNLLYLVHSQGTSQPMWRSKLGER